jgi:hypothetical protein
VGDRPCRVFGPNPANLFGVVFLLSNDMLSPTEDDEPGGNDVDVPEPWVLKSRMWGLTSGGSVDVASNRRFAGR